MKRNLLVKIGILSVSMLVGTIAAINGNIAIIAQSFPDVPLSTVELISTIPSFALIISVLCSSYIARVLKPKTTILTGVLIAAVSGILPYFVSNIYVVLASRAAFGFGVGLFNSLLVTYISSLFDGEDRTSMIGLHQAMGSGGGIIITFISGQLLKYGWQVSFLSYAICFISLILFVLFVPKIAMPQAAKNSTEGSGSMSAVFPWMILIFLTMTCYMTYGIKISSLIKEGGYGSASTGSYVIMALCAGSLITGSSFAKLLKALDRKLLAAGYLITGIAMLLLSISRSEFLTIAAGVISGLGNACIMPYILNHLNSRNLKNAALASSLMYVAYNLGSALSPYGAIVIQSISPFEGISGLFMMLFCLYLILAAVGIIYAVFTKKQNL